jgi:FKBP-type peptidyl-prolyl cis-trans isomerase SlyD
MALLLCSLNVSADEPTKNTIEPGKVVSLRYTVSLPDGEVVHSNVDGGPLKYRQGDGKLLPALEAALVGLAVGDKKSVTLSPEDTYPVNKDAFQEVPLDQIPEDSRQVGAVFTALGHGTSVRVAEVREDTVILDLNHPLAGKTLTYAVTILSVE